jgi:hypothetical protein
MNRRQKQLLQAFRPIQVFLDANASAAQAANASPSRRTLDDVVSNLATHAANQDHSRIRSRSETQKKVELRVELRRQHMLPIARIPKVKGFTDLRDIGALRAPRPNVDVEALLAAAEAMATAATPFTEQFIAEGLGKDFVERLRVAATAVRRSINGRKYSEGLRSGANGGDEGGGSSGAGCGEGVGFAARTTDRGRFKVADGVAEGAAGGGVDWAGRCHR